MLSIQQYRKLYNTLTVLEQWKDHIHANPHNIMKTDVPYPNFFATAIYPPTHHKEQLQDLFGTDR